MGVFCRDCEQRHAGADSNPPATLHARRLTAFASARRDSRNVLRA
jgi:hypothetical protein